MLQKCANPTCNAQFRSLREGKLFLAEARPAGTPGLGRRQPRQREHFWLCQACSCQFTLRYDAQAGMLIVPLIADLQQRIAAEAG